MAPPSESRPDRGDDDRCRAGRRVAGPTDIRAFLNIDDGVETVILPGVRPPMRHNLVTRELTPAALEAIAEARGYRRADLAAMADCLSRYGS